MPAHNAPTPPICKHGVVSRFAVQLDFKFHHFPNRNRNVSVITETIRFRFGPNRYQFVSVWAQSIYIKEPNRASQKRPPSSLNQIICWTIVFCVLSVCSILWNYWSHCLLWAMFFFILWWSSSRFLCVMSQDMSPQVSSLAEWFLTLSTRMGLFSSVCEHVFPQSSSFTERLVACCTFVRLLSSVDHKVPIQILSSTKWLVAPCTLLHFLSSAVGNALVVWLKWLNK